MWRSGCGGRARGAARSGRRAPWRCPSHPGPTVTGASQRAGYLPPTVSPPSCARFHRRAVVAPGARPCTGTLESTLIRQRRRPVAQASLGDRSSEAREALPALCDERGWVRAERNDCLPPTWHCSPYPLPTHFYTVITNGSAMRGQQQSRRNLTGSTPSTRISASHPGSHSSYLPPTQTTLTPHLWTLL